MASSSATIRTWIARAGRHGQRRSAPRGRAPVRVAALDGDINRLVLNIDLRVLEQGTDPLDVDRSVHSLERRERGAADEFVCVTQLRLQCGLNFWRIEAGQQVDDVD